MKQAVLLLDIGGTNTRARLVRATVDLFRDTDIIAEAAERITDRAALLDFLACFTAGPGIDLIFAVASIAGPVNNLCASMTNWTDRPTLGIGDLAVLGLPAGRLVLINDMAAAACCITAFREGKVRLELTRIYHPAAAPVDSGNAVLIIPGTGVGLGAVVAPAPAGPPALPLHISCEIQHTDAARLPEQFGTLAGLMQKRLGRDKLSWEDFVSGRGLVNMHACLADHRAAEDGPDAGEIARRAVAGTEAASVTALACYYHVCGALAQVMALSFQPSAGIFLGGSTTRQNRRFIEQSGFVRACQDNSVRGELLASFPVYLVPEYMNLNGAMYLAQQTMHA